MMRKQQKSILMLATIAVFVTTMVFFLGLVRAGSLEPSAPPGSTMHTLDEIYNKLGQLGSAGPAPIPKTGQTTSYATGDDGDLQRGVAWPDPRFTDHEDGTVTDNLTGLMWTKDANMYGPRDWFTALSKCASCTAGGHSDWRLPNVRELHSMIDYGRDHPVLPAGHPFSNVQQGYYSYYWSSTTGGGARLISLVNGYVHYNARGNLNYVWCVRGGQ